MKYFDTAALRVPLLPVDFLDKIKTKEDLINTLTDPKICEAIFIASPSLFAEIKKKNFDTKTTNSIIKYLQRACTRCTPFGIFASCSGIAIKEGADLNASFQSKARRTVRFDMDFLCKIALSLSKDPVIRNYLKYTPNSSAYRAYRTIRYTETHYQNGYRGYSLSAVDLNRYLLELLHAAKNGTTIQYLTDLLKAQNIPESDARNYINGLIDCQVLVPNLEPAITGKNALEQIIGIIQPINEPHITALYKILLECESILKCINSDQEVDMITLLDNIKTCLTSNNIEFEEKYLFQVDLFRDSDFVLPNYIAEETIGAVKILKQLTASSKNVSLSTFIDKFKAKYEEKEVSLLEVIDVENGLGYPPTDGNIDDENPLVIGLSPVHEEHKNNQWNWNPIQKVIFKKIIESIQNNSKIVDLADIDLKTLHANELDFNDTFSALVSIVDSEPGSVKILLTEAGGASAASLIGRFCYADPNLYNLAVQIANAEDIANGEGLVAEIVHLPSARMGNIVTVPSTRKFEINYLTSWGVPIENRIALDDILLKVVDNKIVLRSKKFNRIIIPKKSNVHNHAFGLPLYQFLCDLQSQDTIQGVGLDLSFFENHLAFIPRIIYKNYIFSPAKWILQSIIFKPASKLSGTDRKIEINRLRREYRLPDKMLLVENDNHLFINWENSLSVEAFLSEIQNKVVLTLCEFLFSEKSALLRSETGYFTNEVVFSFNNRREVSILHQNQTLSTNETNYIRAFLPGSNWLYLKIYTGIKTSDEILLSLFPLLETLGTKGMIEKFFFIRYKDPESHLRIRLKLSGGDFNSILANIHENISAYFQNGLIASMQIDTYKREIERYGSSTIELAESIFFHDSRLSLSLINFLFLKKDNINRWKLALHTVSTYLNIFGLSLNEKIHFTKCCYDGFMREFKFRKEHRIKMDTFYRNNQKEIAGIIKGRQCEEHISKIFEEFSARLINEYSKLENLSNREKNLIYLESYIHMHLNRFFRSRQRLNELMIYFVLNKYFVSELARSKKDKISSAVI